MIETHWELEHIVITVNGKFYCSCDNLKEVNEEISKLR